MSTLQWRVAALEAIVDQKQLRVLFAESGETDDEAIAREVVDESEREVLMVRWG
jgi:hypothetical protein